jgi:hypothetical protein
MKKYFENPAQAYVAPEVEVTEVVVEGAVCAGSATSDWEDDGDPIF